MEITPLGDSALIVRVRDRFEDAPQETLSDVLRTFRRLQNADIPGVIELAPSYTTVAIFFDPLQVAKAGAKPNQAFDWLAERVRAAVAVIGHRGTSRTLPVRVIQIPVCYDPKFAFDLDHVAEHAHVSSREVVDLYSAAEYRVSCVGFVPGFPFLSEI